ncbi:MAG: C4-type zinc ribbon domain-containing protein [Dehalococcoidia bacterium]|jgi:predicted  nucleic acid-binding Zn-ribbon protein
MSVAKQLYRLQEVDLEIESGERAFEQVTSQLGESRTVVAAREKLQQEQERLKEASHQQHDAEWEIDDITTKLAAAEEQLFSGRVKIPKELSNLQHEVEAFKSRRNQLEEQALDIIDKVEASEAKVARISKELEKLTAEWQRQQKELNAEMERLKTSLAELKARRQKLVEAIQPSAYESYQRLRKGKGTAVARVEQGICRGCRISLPTTDLQQARSGRLVSCSSCGRILFLP